ncbi:MAG: hypothetical protein K2P58_09520 [Hyphomonadaceae bacterium]|nr:hypothetical protein [Hyphomonadaceae bacterium]
MIDVSQMRGGQSLILSGLILRRIFDRNQEEFTAADPKTIPTIAVVEEAQSVLNENAQAAEPYIAWVKEGRKYDLGALLITQQPGSIPVEILSQGDNWFIFHLLSAADLGSLKRANAHFSDDLLSSLLNEPIPGQGVFWSSVGGKPYPVSLRAESFERQFSLRDRDNNGSAANTFARVLRSEIVEPIQSDPNATTAAAPGVFPDQGGDQHLDVKASMEARAIAGLRSNEDIMCKLQGTDGIAWFGVQKALMDALPDHIDDRQQLAYNLVPRALDAIFGPQKWETYKNPTTNRTWVRRKGG